MNGLFVCLMEKHHNKTSVCKQNKLKQIIGGICLNSHVDCTSVDAFARTRSNDVDFDRGLNERLLVQKLFSVLGFSKAMHFQVIMCPVSTAKAHN